MEHARRIVLHFRLLEIFAQKFEPSAPVGGWNGVGRANATGRGGSGKGGDNETVPYVHRPVHCTLF